MRTSGAVTGVRGSVLAPDPSPRGVASNRDVIGDFEYGGQAVIVTSGGIGGNHDLVRANWPDRLGTPPADLLTGVPAYVDGRMLAITEEAGGAVVNRDRMWHYVEGVRNWNPVWPGHAIRILPGPSSMWFDGAGNRLPAPFLPGFDTLGTLDHLRHSGYDHSWFVLNQSIVGKEFALSGSEQNLDLTERRYRDVLRRPITKVTPSVKAFLDHGEDWITADTIGELVARMNALTPDAPLDAAHIERQIVERDRQVDNALHQGRPGRRDPGRAALPRGPAHQARLPAAPHPRPQARAARRGAAAGALAQDARRAAHRPSGRVLGPSGEPVPGLYAAGEVAGFGGGGVHGYRALEGTFVGGCLFSGRTAGRSAATDL